MSKKTKNQTKPKNVVPAIDPQQAKQDTAHWRPDMPASINAVSRLVAAALPGARIVLLVQSPDSLFEKVTVNVTSSSECLGIIEAARLLVRSEFIQGIGMSRPRPVVQNETKSVG